MDWTVEGGRRISAAVHANPGFISWDFRGSREGDRLSFGASGMTPSMLRTALPRSADISRTMLRRRPRVDDRWRDIGFIWRGGVRQGAGTMGRREGDEG